MTDVVLKGLFLQQARGLKIADGGGAAWTFNAPTNTLSLAVSGVRVVAGDPASPVDGDLWYNSVTNKFRGRANGISVDLH